MALDKKEKKQLLADLGRMKYMQQSGMKLPPHPTKRMQKHMNMLGITMDDVKPIEVDMTYLEQDKKRKRASRKYHYYINGEIIHTGTKEELAAKTGLDWKTINTLTRARNPKKKGRGPVTKGQPHDTHFVTRAVDANGKHK